MVQHACWQLLQHLVTGHTAAWLSVLAQDSGCGCAGSLQPCTPSSGRPAAVWFRPSGRASATPCLGLQLCQQPCGMRMLWFWSAFCPKSVRKVSLCMLCCRVHADPCRWYQAMLVSMILCPEITTLHVLHSTECCGSLLGSCRVFAPPCAGALPTSCCNRTELQQ